MEQISIYKALSSRINLKKDKNIFIRQFIKIYEKVLSYSNLILHEQIEYRNVIIYQKQHMHQIYTKSTTDLPHLVLIHGFGGTASSFVRFFELLKDNFQVHALQTFGFAFSSLGSWKDQFTTEETYQYYIQAIQQWRKAVQIQQFYLVGHSFGGYLATLYFQKYPTRVKHLFLLTPIGISRFKEIEVIKWQKRKRISCWFIKTILKLQLLRPYQIIKLFIFGDMLIQEFLNQLKLKGQEKQYVRKYYYYLSFIQQTSQKGFYSLFNWPFCPQRTIQQILKMLMQPNKVDFFFGEIDWVSQDGAKRLAKQYQNINYHIIGDSTHKMIFDNPLKIAQKIIKIVKRQIA